MIKVAGVILAAGEGKRFGRSKPLAEWNGNIFIQHVIRTAKEANLDPLIVVTGYLHQPVERALQDVGVTVMYNPDWKAGQSTSLRAGIKTLTEDIQAVVFMMVDQPQITSQLIMALIDRYKTSKGLIVAPCVKGKRTTPVLFDRRLFGELNNIQGDTGGRALFSQYPPILLPWDDDKILLDVDNQADYQTLMTYKMN